MRTGRVIATLLLPLLVTGASGKAQSDNPAPGTVFLNQGWKTEQRQAFYHKAQGTQLIPLPWLLKLKQKEADELFLTDANIARFGFIPDAKSPSNPHGLPVGFAVSQVPKPNPADPTKPIMVPVVGWSCAACHTGRIIAGGRTIQVDGAPSMQNNLAFVEAMLEALGATVADTGKLQAFAASLPGQPDPNTLKGQIAGLIAKIKMTAALEYARQHCTDPAKQRKYAEPHFAPFSNWGPGRLDAIGRASNTVFAGFKDDGTPPWHPCNFDIADGPVSIPKIWNAWKYDWVQWSAFVENPLARNLAQALALGADQASPDLVPALGELEDYLVVLRPPRWDEAFLRTSPIDPQLRQAGELLYHGGRPDRPVKGGLCAHCHVPAAASITKCDGREEWAVVRVPVEEIGTDPTTMENYLKRPKHAGKSQQEQFNLAETFLPSVAMERITSDVMQAGFKRSNVSPDRQRRMQRCRANKWLGDPSGKEDEQYASPSYKVPTHEGVWATAPYLHNGSIPNLYLLLSPQEERDRQAARFCIGHDLTFDPVNVGFKLTDQCEAGFIFDTKLHGNGNKGHEFRNVPDCEKREGSNNARQGILGCELSDHERKALVEYLKTL